MLQQHPRLKFLALFILTALLVQLGCKKSDSLNDNSIPVLEKPVVTNDAVKVTATITGSVIDENNQPVANATVTSDTYTGTTDAMGNFTFRNINISAANGHVTVTKDGYFKSIRSFVTAAGKNNFVKIQLIKQILTRTITATAGGTVITNGAVIAFPANAFVTATGAAYTGNVKVYATWIDPTYANLPLIVPGDLRGINSSNGEYILKSYGMIGAEFKDDNDNTLKLAPGKTAGISFPIPTSLQATAPDNIPLWHFDETTARWKEEGQAIRSGNSYTAQVDKFSFWNVDVPANFITLDMRFYNSANNLPLANTLVKVTSLATNTIAYGHTNDSGYVSGYVPKNEALKLEVVTGTTCNVTTVVYTQNIGPYTSNASLGNIGVTIPANLVVNFTATIKNCNNQPVTNGYISLNLTNGTSTIAYTNAAGIVSFSVPYCGGLIAYTYNAVDLVTGNYSNAASGTSTNNTINLGTLTACGNSINTSGVYIAGYIDNNAVVWKDGVPTFLTNYPATGYKGADALKVLLNNNDVYVLGIVYDSTATGSPIDTIKVWKNGVVINAIGNPNGFYNLDANGFDVYNGDIYIVGVERDGVTHIARGRLWKNGVASTLATGIYDKAEPTNIKIASGDIYISGNAFYDLTSGKRAVYWKNGVINYLSSASSFQVNAENLFIDKNDLYFEGYEVTNIQQTIADRVYWKNGIKTTIAFPPPYSFSYTSSIFVDNNDIYVAGSVSHSNQPGPFYENAVYWKNNNINFLTNSAVPSHTFTVYDVFVKNNIIYTAGEAHVNNTGIYTPLYFQDGVPVPLSGFTNTQAVSCNSIFVK
jgi:hypothetical protein